MKQLSILFLKATLMSGLIGFSLFNLILLLPNAEVEFQLFFVFIFVGSIAAYIGSSVWVYNKPKSKTANITNFGVGWITFYGLELIFNIHLFSPLLTLILVALILIALKNAKREA